MAVFLSCAPAFLIRFSVSRVWFLIHLSYFSLPQILHLPRTSFAAFIRPLFNQFLGGLQCERRQLPNRSRRL